MTFEEAVSTVIAGPDRSQTMAIENQLIGSSIEKLLKSTVADRKKQDSDGQFVAELLYITAIAVRAGQMST